MWDSRSVIRLLLALCLTAATLQGQARITSPKDQIGFNIGDDYALASYAQLVEYWKKLDQESDRLALAEIGTTAEGRPMYMAIITSPENHQKLDRLQEISRRLARAEGLTEAEGKALAAEGRAVVWIDGGLHADEILGAQQLIEMVYQMVSRTDPETMRFLDDVVLLAACTNPDGMDLVSGWYMREPDPTKRSLYDLPRLYHKYAGHDNNRDFYMSSQPETEAINRVLYREWFPQIVYNHHQSAPSGVVMFTPPFRDPFNYHYDPLVMTMLEEVGAAMHSRFAFERKPGVTTRSGANYSTWWNGGLRTSPYFHNMIGLLTEAIGSPAPIEIPFVPELALPTNDLPVPIAPQIWHFRQSVDYSVTANRAVLDYASRNKDRLLLNIYRMGRNAIDRGSRDTWTDTPTRVGALESAQADTSRAGYDAVLRNPSLRNPRGYIISSDQPDFLTAIKFVNALIKNGVTAHRATRQFTVGGTTYPEGSFVVKTAQAFRPHVLDMFESQDHPDDFPYPGAPPTPPYDSTGWTLAYQMGVEFDRILDGFEGPFQELVGEVRPLPGRVAEVANPVGFLLSHAVNDAFTAVNRLLASGEEVYWLNDEFRTHENTYPAGTHFIVNKPGTLPKLRELAGAIGLNFDVTAVRPTGNALRLRPVRIGLWDRYGGSIASGWTRWILEKFEFPFTLVYPRTLDAGNLTEIFDVLIFVDGAVPRTDAEIDADQPLSRLVPAELRERLGSVTVDRTIPQLKKFVEEGGTILAIGNSTNLAYHLRLPVMSGLVERTGNGRTAALPDSKFYVPGSILEARVDNLNPLAYGLSENVDVFFDHSPSFTVSPGTEGVKAVAWYDSPSPLRSGWAWGEAYLQDTVAVIDANVGQGKLFLYGPEILFRAQPHGTFKFLFNGIYYGAARTVDLSQN